MINQEHSAFLKRLQTHSYPDDVYIANAVDHIFKEQSKTDFSAEIEIAEMIVDQCQPHTTIRPEIFICCLVGNQFNKMASKKVIEKFGFTAYEIAFNLQNFPNDFNCDAMFDFFIQQDDDIHLLYHVTATHALETIKEHNLDIGYEDDFNDIQNYINLGMTVEDEEDYPHLHQRFKNVSDYFIAYFENKADIGNNNKKKAAIQQRFTMN